MKYLRKFNEAKASESFKNEFKDFCEGGLAFILDNGEISYDFGRWVPSNTNVCNVEIRLDEAQDWLDIKDYFIPFFERLNANYDISGPIEIATKIADKISSMRNYSYEEVISGELESAVTKRESGGGYKPKHWSEHGDPMASFMDKKYKDKAIVSTIRFKILSKSVNETMTYDEKYDEVLDRCLDLIDLGFDFKLNDGPDYTINYDFKDRKMLASFNKSEKRNIDIDNDDDLSDIVTNYKNGSLYVYDNGDCLPGAYDGLSKDELIKTKDRQELLEAVTDCLFRLKVKFNRVMGYIHFSYGAVRNPFDFQISHIILNTEVRFYVDKSIYQRDLYESKVTIDEERKSLLADIKDTPCYVNLKDLDSQFVVKIETDDLYHNVVIQRIGNNYSESVLSMNWELVKDSVISLIDYLQRSYMLDKVVLEIYNRNNLRGQIKVFNNWDDKIVNKLEDWKEVEFFDVLPDSLIRLSKIVIKIHSFGEKPKINWGR